jgi:DnaJ-class molecular chaperone
MDYLRKCSTCNGTGQVIGKMFFPWIKRLKECPDCEGEGVITIKNKETQKTLL